MQRTAPDGDIIICCDFCGTDWDQVLPMIEGHHGSVICLECLKLAAKEAAPGSADSPGGGKFMGTMCRRENLHADMLRWRPKQVKENANPQAIICGDCIRQAAIALSKDKDVGWTWDRKIGTSD